MGYLPPINVDIQLPYLAGEYSLHIHNIPFR